MGAPSMSTRWMPGGSMPGGRFTRTRSTAVRTSSVAFCMSAPSSNSMLVTEAPSVTALEMCLTLETPATAFSTGRVICVSICAGAAPFCVTDTDTTGKEMLGYCLMGSLP